MEGRAKMLNEVQLMFFSLYTSARVELVFTLVTSCF